MAGQRRATPPVQQRSAWVILQYVGLALLAIVTAILVYKAFQVV